MSTNSASPSVQILHEIRTMRGVQLWQARRADRAEQAWAEMKRERNAVVLEKDQALAERDKYLAERWRATVDKVQAEKRSTEQIEALQARILSLEAKSQKAEETINDLARCRVQVSTERDCVAWENASLTRENQELRQRVLNLEAQREESSWTIESLVPNDDNAEHMPLVSSQDRNGLHQIITMAQSIPNEAEAIRHRCDQPEYILFKYRGYRVEISGEEVRVGLPTAPEMDTTEGGDSHQPTPASNPPTENGSSESEHTDTISSQTPAEAGNEVDDQVVHKLQQAMEGAELAESLDGYYEDDDTQEYSGYEDLEHPEAQADQDPTPLPIADEVENSFKLSPAATRAQTVEETTPPFVEEPGSNEVQEAESSAPHREARKQRKWKKFDVRDSLRCPKWRSGRCRYGYQEFEDGIPFAKSFCFEHLYLCYECERPVLKGHCPHYGLRMG